MQIKNMTEQDRAKLYRQLYKRLKKNCNGGRLFGMDWTTMSILYPQITSVMRQIEVIK